MLMIRVFQSLQKVPHPRPSYNVALLADSTPGKRGITPPTPVCGRAKRKFNLKSALISRRATGSEAYRPLRMLPRHTDRPRRAPTDRSPANMFEITVVIEPVAYDQRQWSDRTGTHVNSGELESIPRDP